MPIKPYIEEHRDYIIALRRHFHRHPEVSMEEYETADRIEQELHSFGIETRRVGKTGVYGQIKGKKSGNRTDIDKDLAGKEDTGKPNTKRVAAGKRIILRADIDALRITEENQTPYTSQNPGVMHACGHDAHTAALLGAAKILKEKSDEFAGTVDLFFQQGEEFGQGARLFVADGLVDGADRVFGIHVAPDTKAGDVAISAGPVNASVDHFKICVLGKSAHVSTPHLGVDALYIGAQIVTALQGIVSRQTDPLDTVVVGIGVLQAGTAYNIVAQEALIEGTTRCFTNETRKAVNDKIRLIAESIAAANGAVAKVSFDDYASPLINDETACKELSLVASELLGKEHIVPKKKSLGGDDFADYLQKVRGVYAYVGTGNEDAKNTTAALHTKDFDIDEEGLLIGANLYVDYALKVLNEK